MTTNTFQQAERMTLRHRAVANQDSSHAMALSAVPAIQKKDMEDEELQLKSAVQLATPEEDELQMKSAGSPKNNATSDVTQRKDNATPETNHTGMPDQLKTGIENLSGLSMDDVKVHYNSSQPAQLNALAYAQGTDIHVAPGQERHLPHEAWHVVQQKQGRVRPTMQMKGGINVNDDKGLENEADVMGGKALQSVDSRPEAFIQRKLQKVVNNSQQSSEAAQPKKLLFQLQSIERPVIQKFDAGVGNGWHIHYGEHVKYDSNNATRVNFGGRTRRQIGYQWEQVIQDNGLAGTKGDPDFIACKTWIRNNI